MPVMSLWGGLWMGTCICEFELASSGSTIGSSDVGKAETAASRMDDHGGNIFKLMIWIELPKTTNDHQDL